MAINNVRITDCRGVAASDGSQSAAIMATDYFGPGTAADITNSTFRRNSSDLFVGYLSTDASVVTITSSRLGLGQQIIVSNPNLIVDARGNNWGTNDIAVVRADLANPNILVDPLALVSNPQTGQRVNWALWAAIAAACMGAVWLLAKRKVTT